MATFDPNAKTLEACLTTIAEAQKSLAIDTSKIITSRQRECQEAAKRLACTAVPSGFNKWLLPFNTTREATFYLSFGAPNTVVPVHSHDEGEGIRVILFGSIIYGGQELVAGDWMYLPARAKYEFKVGPMGVGQFYCYCCCCGGVTSE
jgi:hypothetical protein